MIREKKKLGKLTSMKTKFYWANIYTIFGENLLQIDKRTILKSIENKMKIILLTKSNNKKNRQEEYSLDYF